MTEADVLDALRGVEDPEAGMNIVDLGLVYGVDISPAAVGVAMTMTSPSCPAGPWLVSEATGALGAALPEGTRVEVSLVWEPAWTPQRMSPEARARFGWARK